MIGLLVCLTVCLSCSKDDGVLGQLDEALSNYHQYVSQKEDVLDGLKENMQNAQSKKEPHTVPVPSLILPTADARVKAPWQWSVNMSAGVQYQLLPHVNAYFEPHLQYYIPTGNPVETYRTEHPFDLSLPFGIRFTW